MNSKLIDYFFGEYRFLSNFYIGEHIQYKGMIAKTVEHLFQASKYEDEEHRNLVLEALLPKEAKSLGNKFKCRKDWDDIKYDIMLELVRLKFKDTNLKVRLYNTGDAVLIEGNYWHDNIWGRCTCDKCKDKHGTNWLGKILMSVRFDISLTKEEEQLAEWIKNHDNSLRN